MNIERVAEKLSGVAKKIEASKGPLELLGLFLREDSLDLWDVVIAAPWLSADKLALFEYVGGQLRRTLTDEEMIGLSRIVILEHGEAVLKSILAEFGNRSGLSDVNFELEGGAVIRRVYIIAARPAANGAHRGNSKKPRRSTASPQGSPRSPGESR